MWYLGIRIGFLSKSNDLGEKKEEKNRKKQNKTEEKRKAPNP